MVRGSFTKRPSVQWVDYDRFEVSGAKCLNPSFEESRDGVITDWLLRDLNMRKDRPDAADGKNYIRCAHDFFAVQYITFKAGTRVTIRFRVRAGSFAKERPAKTPPLRLVNKADAASAQSAGGARPERLRIDISGEKINANFCDVRCSSGLVRDKAPWLPEAVRSSILVFTSEPLDGQWREFAVTFTSKRSGWVRMLLRGAPSAKNGVQWIDFDHFRTSNAYVFNPSFEDMDKGAIAYWQMPKASMRFDQTDAADGKNYARCAHDFPAVHYIHLRPDVPVTIRFRARSGGFTAERPADRKLQGKPTINTGRFVPDRPKSYYRYYGRLVRYLPLKDKGIVPDMLVYETGIVPGAYPEAKFVVPAPGKAPAVERTSFPVELLEENGIARTAPIRFGFPVAKNTLFDLEHIAVTDPKGRKVPAQFAVLGRWPDQSIKWVLTQFAAPLEAKENAVYTVSFGRDVTPDRSESPLRLTETETEFIVDNGSLRARISKTRFTVLEEVLWNGTKVGSLAPEGVLLRNEAGAPMPTGAQKPEKIVVLENGSRRIELKLEGQYGPDSPGTCTVRIGFTAGSPVIDLAVSHTDTRLKTEFTDITSLDLKVHTRPKLRSLTMLPQSGDAKLSVPRGKGFFQEDERTLRVAGKKQKASLNGAGTAAAADGGVTFALEDAAFRYPKGFGIAADTLDIGILPELPDAKFGTKLPYYLQFPFCEGKYRLKWGMSFTERIKIDFTGQISADALGAMDIVPVIDRDYLHATGAVPGVLPGNNTQFADWNRTEINGFNDHLAQKATQREYGFLNYGDSFGERGRNWTNNEYDLAHGMFMLFARTGNRDVFRWGVRAARHQADVDIIHAYPDPFYLGANAQHGIGHTGINHQRHIEPATWSYPLDYSFTGTNGHTWSDGMMDAWCFTGDSRVMDAALMLGEHLTRYTAPRFRRLETHERTAGWSVKALLAFYRVTGDPKFLEAAGKIVRIALKEQNFEKGGAWPHKLPRDHAGGYENTFGNTGFLIGTLISCLREYHLLTGDPAVARAIASGAKWQMGNWDAGAMGFPYTASWDNKPYFPISHTLNMLVMPGIAYRAVLTGDRRAYEIACDAVSMATVTSSQVGKSLGLRLVYAGDAIADIAEYERLHPEVKPYRFEATEMLHRLHKREASFNARGPDHKEMEIRLLKPEAEVTVVRVRTGARPDFKPECSFTITDPDGKVVASRTWKTTERAGTETFRLSGKVGDVFKLVIDDDMTGHWNVKPGSDHITRVKLVPGSSFSNASPAEFYFDVPAGTKRFSVMVQGVHLGSFRAWVFFPDGKVAGEVSGCNIRSVRLPWIKSDPRFAKRQELKVELDEPTATDGVWKLLVLTVNDVQLGITGIPPYLRIVPGKK